MPSEQTIIAAAAIVDAALSSVDPSGVALQRTYETLRLGLELADNMGVESGAGELVRALLKQIKDINE